MLMLRNYKSLFDKITYQLFMHISGAFFNFLLLMFCQLSQKMLCSIISHKILEYHGNMEEGAIFRDKIENHFPCSQLARRDRDFHFIILMF